ncbi:MAG: ZIP family metal transporter [Elusimicrobia bacterium]|nr:ZIP family metal transporter [Elusimicrobiota bacterium]
MIILFSIIAVIFTLIGGGIALKLGSLNKKFLIRTLSYASGILISVVFLDLLPAGWELNRTNLTWGILGALLALFLAESFTVLSSRSEFLEECEVHAHNLGIFAFIALALHSLLDGVNIAVGFKTGTAAGFNVSLGVILHKFADGVTLVALLLHGGRTKKQAFCLSLALAAATPLGAAMMGPFLRCISPDVIALFLGISSGSFLYIAMADILPQLHKANDRVAPFLFPLGYLTVVVMNRFGG